MVGGMHPDRTTCVVGRLADSLASILRLSHLGDLPLLIGGFVQLASDI